jgi:nicotinamidase-related amidase
MLLDRQRSCLLLVDLQERLLPAMAEAARVVANSAVLARAAARLGVPVLLSEQYPKGLGRTVPELAALVPQGPAVEKSEFSCAAAPGYRERLAATGRDQLVVAGIEAHVCVLQTALQFREIGYPVFVVADAVSSRKPESVALALARMRDAGAVPVTTEMVLFEWLGRAGTPEFKELSALIR